MIKQLANWKQLAAELERVRVAIGEAPARLEQSRGLWETVESEYCAWRQKLADEIPQFAV